MNSATRYNPAGPPTPAPQAAGPHAPKWCPAMVKAGLIPKLTLDAPHFLHVIRSSVRLSRHRSRVCSAASSLERSNAAAVRGGQGIVLDNITITTSPSWTLVSLISGHQSVLLCKQ